MSNSLSWRQQTSTKRIFSSKEEEAEFFKGIVNIDLLDKIGRKIYSHKEKHNTITLTEKKAEEEGRDLKQLDYDRRRTAEHNNKKFEQKIMNVMVIDCNEFTAKVNASEIESLGHLAYVHNCVEDASRKYALCPHDWDLVIMNDVYGDDCHKLHVTENKGEYVKCLVSTLKKLFGRMLKLNADQKVVVQTMNNYREIFKQVMEKHDSKYKIMLCKRSPKIIENEGIVDFVYKVS